MNNAKLSSVMVEISSKCIVYITPPFTKAELLA